MDVDMNIVRGLGAVQLLVIVGSVVTERLLTTAIGSDNIKEMLTNISKNLRRIRLSNLISMAQSLAIITLGVLYYLVFQQAYQTIALISLGCFLTAGVVFAVSKIGTNALIPLSQDFIDGGAPEDSYYQKQGSFLYHGVDRKGNDIHMLFTCIGLLLVNYLFLISESIPRGLSIWGLAAIFLMAIPSVFALYDREFMPGAVILAIPYAPY